MVVFYLAVLIPITPKCGCREGFKDLAFFVITWKENETNQLSLIVWLMSQYGMVMSSILLHVYLSRQNLAVKVCQRFRIFVGTWPDKRDNPTILNAVTKVEVWNGNVIYLAAPMPIPPKFCCPQNDGCRNCFCHINWKEISQLSLMLLLKLKYGMVNVFYLAAPMPLPPKFCSPLNDDVNGFAIFVRK